MGRSQKFKTDCAPWAVPLREAKAARKMSLRAIRMACGLALPTIWKIMQGDKNVLVRHIVTVAAVVGLELSLKFKKGV